MSKTWKRFQPAHELGHFLIAFSDELDEEFAQTKEENWEELIRASLGRLTAGLKSKENAPRIFDARLEDGILHIVSADFERLKVSMSKVEPLAKAASETAERFEIDEDGSYIYWPDLDLHRG